MNVSIEVENYIRECLLISLHGREILKNVVSEWVSKQSVTDMDEFLRDTRNRIINFRGKKKLNEKQLNLLFPKEEDGGKTDVTKWDITLLSWFILNFIDVPPTNLSIFVMQLRTWKNETVSHPECVEVESSDFEYFSKTYRNLAENLMEGMDDNFQTKIMTDLQQTLQHDIVGIFKSMTDESCLKHIRGVIEKDEFDRKKMVQELFALLDLAHEHPVQVQVTLPLDIHSPDQDVKERAADTLFQAVTKIIQKVPGAADEVTLYVKMYIERLEKDGAVVTGTTRGCLLIEVRCLSASAVRRILDFFNGDESKEKLSMISKGLGKSVKGEVDIEPKAIRLSHLRLLYTNIAKQVHRESYEKVQKIKAEALALPMDTTESAKSEMYAYVPGRKVGEVRTSSETTDEDDGTGFDSKDKKRKMDIRSESLETVKAAKEKVFLDPLHGHIELSPLCVIFIDTPQFQRLRYLKQVSNCYFVYPGASHNRFEHSIGTCHLAGKLVRSLQERQPELNIDEKDVMCVELAGLCHDLGHGPYSHLFDQKFIQRVDPKAGWKHEEASLKMLDHLIERNNLKPVMREIGLEDKDISFIKELIIPPNGKKKPFSSRPEEKSFLYEIVSNEINGIDVDKWDYFSRDCHMTGIKNSFDYLRCIQFARVIQCRDGRKHICFRDKEAADFYEMYLTRLRLHRSVYQHKINNIMNYMVTDALLLADKNLTYTGENGKSLCLSQTIYDMSAYTKVNDNVFFKILDSSPPIGSDMARAKQILEDLLSRRLYAMVTKTQLKFDQFSISEATVAAEELSAKYQEVLEEKKQEIKTLDVPDLTKEDIIVDPVNFDYGKKEINPIDFVWFYSKHDINKPIRIRKEEVSLMLPITFAEQHLRVYCKVKDATVVGILKEAFSVWCEEKGLPGPR